jgi:hypothetical protein
MRRPILVNGGDDSEGPIEVEDSEDGDFHAILVGEQGAEEQKRRIEGAKRVKERHENNTPYTNTPTMEPETWTKQKRETTSGNIVSASSGRGGGIDSDPDIYPTGTFKTHAWVRASGVVETETKKTYQVVKDESSSDDSGADTTVLGTVVFTLAENSLVSTSVSYEGDHDSIVKAVGGCVQLTAETPSGPGGVTVRLVAVEIAPDESMYETALVPSIGGGGVIGMIAQSIGVGVGQEGRIGDLVPIVMKDGVKHFVSPKKTEQLDDEYVILTADGISAEDFTNLGLAWEGSGTIQHAEANKIQVSRSAPEKVEVRLKSPNGKTIDEMYVWIVWATAELTITEESFRPEVFPRLTDEVNISGFQFRAGAKVKFTISPNTLFADTDDIPDLKGPNESDPPGGDLKHVVTDMPLAQGATMKWDVSRQVSATIKNQHLFGKRYFPHIDGTLYDAQPVESDNPAEFPSEKLIGNDDAGVDDESNDPYQENTDPDLEHEKGDVAVIDTVIAQFGTPSDPFTAEYEELLNFNEFLRLEINGKWYLISPFEQWFFRLKAIKRGQSWFESEDESKSGKGHINSSGGGPE